MYDLSNSGLSLRTMKPKDLGTFAADLNHNFMSILHAAGFKGMPGTSITGPTGIGQRGSNWFFITTRINDFMTGYGLTGGAEVTIAFLNAAMNANQNLLAITVGLSATDTFVEGDSIVLSSGQVVQLDMIVNGAISTPTWVDTGVTFEQTIGLTADKVREIILEMIGSPSDAESIFRRFAAVAKNHSDASPGTNTALNNDSVIDIPTSDAGPGVVYPDHYIIAPKEQAIGLSTRLCLLAGSPQKYHRLIQQTQEALTNEYAPGVDDFASAVFLQSSYKNGIIMGHGDSGTTKDFMRMYKTTTSLIIASHYSPNIDDYSEFQLTNSKILLRASNEFEINANHLYFTGNRMTSKFFSFDGNVASIGGTNAQHILNIYAKSGVYLRNHKNKHFISTDVNGKVTTPLSLVTALTGTLTHEQVASALSIQNVMSSITSTLDNHTTRIIALENANNELNFKARGYVSSGNVQLNNYQTEGNYVFSGSCNINMGPQLISGSNIHRYHLNVYKVESTQDNVTEVHQTLTTAIVDTVGATTYKVDLSYIRFGYGVAETTTINWTGWTRQLTSADAVTVNSGLKSIGTLAENNLTIQHEPRSNDINSSVGFADGLVVDKIFTDEYGHPTKYETKNLDARYYTKGLTYTKDEVDALVDSNMVVQSGVYSIGSVNDDNDQNIDGLGFRLYPPSGFTMRDFAGHIYALNKVELDGGGSTRNKTHAWDIISDLRGQYIVVRIDTSYRVRINDTNANIRYMVMWQKRK